MNTNHTELPDFDHQGHTSRNSTPESVAMRMELLSHIEQVQIEALRDNFRQARRNRRLAAVALALVTGLLAAVAVATLAPSSLNLDTFKNFDVQILSASIGALAGVTTSVWAFWRARREFVRGEAIKYDVLLERELSNSRAQQREAELRLSEALATLEKATGRTSSTGAAASAPRVEARSRETQIG